MTGLIANIAIAIKRASGLWRATARASGAAVLLICTMLPAQAKTISGEVAARVTEVLATCVAAVAARSDASFEGWVAQDGYVPVGYMFHDRWISPSNDVRVFFAQRSDKPGRPHTCIGELLREEGNDLDNARDEYQLVDWVKSLPETRLAGVAFARSDQFKRPENADVLSACMDGHRLILNARIAPNGSAMFGLMTPYGEVLKC